MGNFIAELGRGVSWVAKLWMVCCSVMAPTIFFTLVPVLAISVPVAMLSQALTVIGISLGPFAPIAELSYTLIVETLWLALGAGVGAAASRTGIGLAGSTGDGQRADEKLAVHNAPTLPLALFSAMLNGLKALLHKQTFTERLASFAPVNVAMFLLGTALSYRAMASALRRYFAEKPPPTAIS